MMHGIALADQVRGPVARVADWPPALGHPLFHTRRQSARAGEMSVALSGIAVEASRHEIVVGIIAAGSPRDDVIHAQPSVRR
jgi:hypothetical protein